MTMADWKKLLREEGYLEIPGFRIELTLDNTFMDLDYIPRIIVYDEETGKWHVLRNPIPKGKTLEENWDNAVEVLARISAGEEEPQFGEEGVAERFALALMELDR
ncbi:hypothetical protein A3L11_02355 [Thermococcus siculi]|uniref:Uncharacterized protein n=1 Tax=Thermococcus siculi TaxID=72803 RepID=A0A2Z2MIC1_9EURY|nr:hypothetical protein [Thermococcus siculi]ASJ08129.1 hypothetical protein A3L11_02355 [Thermococcus siculi]